MQTGFVYSDEFLLHNTTMPHPESPKRLKAIVSKLEKSGLLEKLTLIPPKEASEKWIETIHDKDFILSVKTYCEEGIRFVDTDTEICKDSFRIAKLAVGGVLEAIDKVISGEIKNAFCAVRPPGHHAEKDKIMGFCLFNNVAIGAKYLQQKHKIEKIAIVDFDVHHGNGTQNSFYEDETVLYVSTHQVPLYPGTGSADETGDQKGEGFTLNLPLKPESSDFHFLEKFQNYVIPKLEEFKPEFLLLSAGFDAHKSDPLSNLRVSTAGFGKVTKMLKNCAEKVCKGRIVSVLEGGYNLDALAEAVEEHLKELRK
ncbi:histone deacetylase [bacterium]|nr:histone deacetylase [bacterium]